ncbi:flavodoxin family protein [Clostridium bowmanii]|uniref:flavodoxin family protein n=1 Tax=Clostridium bowmanii TaxID=132925 RepID=UPI001C0AFCC8|nr:flavodoxin family protein [Clostridium bowmanii]MBU3190033.1 flavodoxin family protein [Clostridium bowmanii]MCA1074530.1 flavodoxin family protein [Clostridium bowmanii]
MLNVIAINSSNRKMNTYELIVQVKEILKNNNINVEIINLFDYDIKTCIGCEHCLVKGGCVLNDQVSDVMEKIKLSDGIILTSPVYMENVSGMLKTFFDRTCMWFHRPVIYGKPVLLISTTKGSGLKPTLKYLERVVIQWGGFNVGKIGRTIRTIDNKITESECDNFIGHLNMKKENYKPSLSALINFQVQKVLAYKLIGLDSEYWKEKGWNADSYYFECRINIFKKLIATSFGKFLNKVVNK